MAKISGKGIAEHIAERVLDFLNNAQNSKEIASLGYASDDVSFGYGDQIDDYDIGEVVAQRILDKRESIGGFKELSQLSDIKGFGIDKFNDLVTAFSLPQPSQSSLRTVEPLFRFASLRYHDTNSQIPTKLSKDGIEKISSKELLDSQTSSVRSLSKHEVGDLEKAHVVALANLKATFIEGVIQKLEKLSVEYYTKRTEELQIALDEHNNLIKNNIENYEENLSDEEKEKLESKKKLRANSNASGDEKITWERITSIYPPELFPTFEFNYVAFSSLEYLKERLSKKELNYFEQNNLFNLDSVNLKKKLADQLKGKKIIASYSGLDWKKTLKVNGNPIVIKNRYKNGYVISINNNSLLLSIVVPSTKSYLLNGNALVTINEKEYKSTDIKLRTNNTRLLLIDIPFKSFPDLATVTSFSYKIDIELNSGDKIYIDQTVSSQNDIWVGQYSTMSSKARLEKSATSNTGLNGLIKLGWADLMRVEQKLCCYVPGAIAHIENIMAREYKEKSTENLERSENTFTSETETETIEKNDTTSVEKHDWNKEIKQTIQRDFKFNFGTNVSYGNKDAGSWYVGLNAGMSFANSKTQASTNASSYSKTVTDQASESIRNKSFEKRSTTLIKQFKEENKHGFDNRSGDSHVSGVFRWIDKIYNNKIVNYGKGMVYEFMIPKPSELYVETLVPKDDSDDTTLTIEKPDHPGLKSWREVTRDNYMGFINKYGVSDFQVPQDDVLFDRFETGTIESKIDWDAPNKIDETRKYTFPPNIATAYNLEEVISSSDYRITVDNHPPVDPNAIFQVYLKNSNTQIKIAENGNFWWWVVNEIRSDNIQKSNLNFENEVDIYVYGKRVTRVNHINLDFKFRLKETIYQQWQQDTYASIMAAYNAKLQAYNDALSAQQNDLDTTNTDASLYDADKYKNPGFYQEIIQTELKRLCIELLLQNSSVDRCAEYYTMTRCNDTPECEEIPMLSNLDNLDKYAALVKFVEQSFLWSLSSHNLYQYYWGGKCDWADMLHNEDTPDNDFQKFLKSGMARVIVPVREGFEKVVAYFIATGEPWFGQEPPIIDDPLYVSIVNELTLPVGAPVGEPWNTTVPSRLTLLQGESVYLKGEGLPCCDDVSGGSGVVSSDAKMEGKDDVDTPDTE